MPPRDARAEFRSLSVQHELRRGSRGSAGVDGRVVSEWELDQVVGEIVKRYPKYRAHSGLRGELGQPHGITRAVVEEMLALFKQSAGVGLPLAARMISDGVTPSVANARARYEDVTVDVVLELLDALLREDFEDAGYDDPLELFLKLGICPARAMVKGEFHKMEKIESGRLRLVWSVSLIENVVWRFVCARFSHAMQAVHLQIPSSEGFGIGTDAQIKEFYGAVEGLFLGVVSFTNDNSGYDLRKIEEALMLDCRVRLACLSDAAPQQRRILRNLYWVSRHPLVTLSDGRVFSGKCWPGLQLSGKYPTLSDNSLDRFGLDLIAALRLGLPLSGVVAKVQGDDSRSTVPFAAVSIMQSLGYKITDWEEATPQGGFEFCSHRWIGGIAIPLNWVKMLAKLLQEGYSPEREEGVLRQALRHSPQLGHVEDVLLRAGWFPQKEQI